MTAPVVFEKKLPKINASNYGCFVMLDCVCTQEVGSNRVEAINHKKMTEISPFLFDLVYLH